MNNVNTIHTGDAFEVLDHIGENNVHAVVTDPPYGLAFMGRDWDDFEPKEYQGWCERWASKVKRVLKPGGHLLAFSGNRTHHRLFSGVEDAGFEIRDTVTWHYGSGFPKALDVSKAIDKTADAEREVVGSSTLPNGEPHEYNIGYGEGVGYESKVTSRKETAPATDAAKKWDGFKTALKPATEYVVVARKPFDGTVAENVQTHGTGALNIDGCRVGNEERTQRNTVDQRGGMVGGNNTEKEMVTETGRYPSNVVFDERAAEDLDRKNDNTISTGGVPDDGQSDERHDWGANVQESTGGLGDSGGVSRYFYTSKASKSERTLDGTIENAHPTVKPQDLMEWLVKLVTAEGQVVLDPFAGTGTTLKAAKDLNRRFIGIEKQAKWADVARVRCNLTPNNPGAVRSDDGQEGLEAYGESDD